MIYGLSGEKIQKVRCFSLKSAECGIYIKNCFIINSNLQKPLIAPVFIFCIPWAGNKVAMSSKVLFHTLDVSAIYIAAIDS